MEEFSDSHEFTTHELPSDHHNWWVGRLVKAKYDIFKGMAIPNRGSLSAYRRSESIPEGTVGVVVDVHATDGMLEVMWTTGGKCFASFHDVLSKN
jgi:hypothetical protein